MRLPVIPATLGSDSSYPSDAQMEITAARAVTAALDTKRILEDLSTAGTSRGVSFLACTGTLNIVSATSSRATSINRD